MLPLSCIAGSDHGPHTCCVLTCYSIAAFKQTYLFRKKAVHVTQLDQETHTHTWTEPLTHTCIDVCTWPTSGSPGATVLARTADWYLMGLQTTATTATQGLHPYGASATGQTDNQQAGSLTPR